MSRLIILNLNIGYYLQGNDNKINFNFQQVQELGNYRLESLSNIFKLLL